MEGLLHLLPHVFGPPLLVERDRTLRFPHVNMNKGGEGVQTLCPLNHLPHKQAPCVGGISGYEKNGGYQFVHFDVIN